MRAGFPVKKGVYVSIGLLVFFALGIFFLIAFARAESDVAAIGQSLTHSECQDSCQEFLGQAFNYNNCDEFKQKPAVQEYLSDCVNKTGACEV